MRKRIRAKIPSDLLERLAGAKFSLYGWKVLMAVLRETYGRGKPEGAPISRARFEDLTGLDGRNIDKALKRLESRLVLRRGTKGKRGTGGTIWRLLPPQWWIKSSPKTRKRRRIKDTQITPGKVSPGTPKPQAHIKVVTGLALEACLQIGMETLKSIFEARGYSLLDPEKEMEALRAMLGGGYTLGDIFDLHNDLLFELGAGERPPSLVTIQEEIGECKARRGGHDGKAGSC